jgi:hypothetical protein
MIRKIFISVLLAMVCVTAFADAQGDRKKFIDQLIGQGFFKKIDVIDSQPYVWATPTFNSLDFQTKTNCLSVVYGFYITENPDYDVLVIMDSVTGSRLGEYKKSGGLKLQ